MATTSSILDALTRSLGSAAFAKAAGTYRESEPAVTKAFTVAVASVLAPLVARAGDSVFLSRLIGMVRDVPADVTLLDEPDRLFHRSVSSVEETDPVAMLRSLVFSGNTQTITNAISNASGVKPSTAASLFSVALPTALGYLSRLVTRENLLRGRPRQTSGSRTDTAHRSAASGSGVVAVDRRRSCCKARGCRPEPWEACPVSPSWRRRTGAEGIGRVDRRCDARSLRSRRALCAARAFSQRTCGNAGRDRHRGLCCASST